MAFGHAVRLMRVHGGRDHWVRRQHGRALNSKSRPLLAAESAVVEGCLVQPPGCLLPWWLLLA